MRLVLDLDGTIYGSSIALKQAVVPLLKDLICRYCCRVDETFEEGLCRLQEKHQTKSMFMMLCLELGWTEQDVLEVTYVAGLENCPAISLRPGIQELLEEVQVATVLSNAPNVWVEYLCQQLGITRYIHGVYGLHRNFLVEKPDVSSFLQLPQQDVIFVDDVLGNCVVASRLGWKTFWFPEVLDVHQRTVQPITQIDSGYTVLEYLRREGGHHGE